MRTVLLAIAMILLATPLAEARTIYVNSRIGSNAWDGTTPEPINAFVGPVATLQRAMELLNEGDSLELVDNGTPYYGSITLFGIKHSGTTGDPFRLNGNGAIISGTKPVHPDSWTELGDNLWRITPIRKGWYQLVESGEAVPRVEMPWPPTSLPNMPAGSWGVHENALYYKAKSFDDPRLHEFELASEQTGLTLLDVRNVVISNVTFRHFRLDGINAHDRCQGVRLINVKCLQNGRAGLCVGGTSRIELGGSNVAGNHQHSLLITELGEASVRETEFDRPPTVTDPRD